jgi:hypothetical protein
LFLELKAQYRMPMKTIMLITVITLLKIVKFIVNSPKK